MKLHANGITHHLSVQGVRREPAFVFLHSFGGSAESWSEVIEAFRSQAFCVAPDLRGFGQTEAPAGGYAVADYADDIAALLETLELSRYVLVGHSMGGKIALALAARRPPGLAGLVLIAPSPPTPEPMPEAERARMLNGYGQREAALKTVARATHHALADAVREAAVRDSLRSSQLAWTAWLEWGSREDISRQMAQIAVPVRVLMGRNDALMQFSQMQREIAAPTDGTLAVISDAGHLLPLETPAAILPALRAFLPGAVAEPASYPCGTTRGLLDSDLVTARTREVLSARFKDETSSAPRFFSAAQYAVLQAACARIVPRAAATRLAAAIDRRLEADDGDGWRYAEMPDDREAYMQGLRGLDDTARAMHGADFEELAPRGQDEVLTAIQRGEAAGETWETLDARRFFEEFATECAELYYGEIEGLDEIGYTGFADAHGWQAIGLNTRASFEPASQEPAMHVAPDGRRT